MTVRRIAAPVGANFVGQLYKPKVKTAIEQYALAILNYHGQQSNMHNQLKAIDLAYMRESEDLVATEADVRAVATAANKLPDIVVPVVMPQVEAAVAHLHGLFLTGTPIFGIVANPQKQLQADQIEAVIYENSKYAGWVPELTRTYRNGLKYNIMATEVAWCYDTTYVLTTDVLHKGGEEGKPKEVIWEGNKLKNLDIYNVVFDNRVEPSKVHSEGEFAGYLELKSRIATKMLFNSFGEQGINFKQALEAPLPVGNSGYCVPQLNASALYTSPNAASYATFDWLNWAVPGVYGNIKQPRVNYQNMYEVFTLYARILPEEFGLNVPAKNTPQIWKFIFINNVLVFGQRQTNAHNWLPIVMSQPISDGLGVQTKSFAQNIICYQDLATALWKAKLASERRKISDRMFYDPLRIRPEDINSPSATAKIPVRMGLFGKGLSDAFASIPFRDDSSATLIPEAQAIANMAYDASGLNRPALGQFQRGNKTLEEFRTTMENSGQIMELIGTNVAGQHMEPIQQMVLINVQQYQTASTLSLPKGTAATQVEVNPVELRDSMLTFKVANGLTPVSKLINSGFIAQFLQLYQTTPQLQTEFDIVGLVNYMASVQGVDNLIAAFRRTPEQQQQIMQQQQAAQGSQGIGVPVASSGE